MSIEVPEGTMSALDALGEFGRENPGDLDSMLNVKSRSFKYAITSTITTNPAVIEELNATAESFVDAVRSIGPPHAATAAPCLEAHSEAAEAETAPYLCASELAICLAGRLGIA